MKKALKEKLHKYINDNDGWHKKVDLFVLGDQWGYSPESTSRRLRDLEEEGLILKDTYNGTHAKNLMKYAKLNTPLPSKPSYEIIEENGVRVARLVTS